MTTEKGLATTRGTAIVTGFTLPDEETLKSQIEAINRFQELVHRFLIDGQDYGVIPGVSKPGLFKPGAEKITKLLSLADTYEIIDKVEDWTKPLFRYMVKCTLTWHGEVVSEGMGECNSMEAKYRWRDARPICTVCGNESIIKGKKEYGGGWLCWEKKSGCGTKWPDGDSSIEKQATGKVPNDDIYSLVNTILKMAEKRALVDAALHAGRLSNVFTQDIEDLNDNEVVGPKPAAKASPPVKKVSVPETVTPPSDAPGRATVATTEPVQEKAQAQGDDKAGRFDKMWLVETLKLAHWKPGTLQTWIKNTLKENVSGTIYEMVATLPADKQEKLAEQLQGLREAAGQP